MNPDKTRIGSPSFFNVFFIISTFPEGYSHCLSTVLDERARVVVQPRQNQVLEIKRDSGFTESGQPVFENPASERGLGKVGGGEDPTDSPG